MGCGSSSLKGEGGQGGNTNEVHEEPIRKVATNFSTVDYDQEITQQRRNTEYAPHETVRALSESSDAIRNTTNTNTAKEEGAEAVEAAAAAAAAPKEGVEAAAAQVKTPNQQEITATARTPTTTEAVTGAVGKTTAT